MNFITAFYARYAHLGFSTIPIKTLAYAYGKDDAKQPLVAWKAYQDRLPTPAEVLAWGKQFPSAGIAVVCGLVSDLLVVDDDRATRPPLDPPRTESQERDYQAYLSAFGSHEALVEQYRVADDFIAALRMIDTAVDKTSRGHHYYFRLPRDQDGNPLKFGKRTGFLPGVDCQAEGSYVIVPPSIHPTGTAYVWEREPEDGIAPCPNWVSEAIKRLPAVIQHNTNTYDGVGRDELGQRGKKVFQGARDSEMTRLIGYLISLNRNPVSWKQNVYDVAWQENLLNFSPNLSLQEFEKCYKSITSKEMESHGGTKKQVTQIYVPGSLPERISAQQLGVMDLHAPDYAVNGFFVDGTTQLFGKPKSGKSWLAMQASVAVATGRPLFPPSIAMHAFADHPGGFDTHQGDVLYIALEDSELRLRDRIRIVLNGLPMPERLEFATQWPNLHDGGLVAIEDWMNIKAHPRLVVIDPFAAFVGQEQRASGSVFRAEYRMFRPIWELGQRRKMPIVIVDHASKGKGKMGSTDPYDSGSGTLGSQASVDTIMIMEHSDKGNFARINYKGRDLERSILDLEHTKQSPVWKIAAPAMDSEDEKMTKDTKKSS